MITYFRENSNEDEPDVQAETDRYIAIPARRSPTNSAS